MFVYVGCIFKSPLKFNVPPRDLITDCSSFGSIPGLGVVATSVVQSIKAAIFSASSGFTSPPTHAYWGFPSTRNFISLGLTLSQACSYSGVISVIPSFKIDFCLTSSLTKAFICAFSSFDSSE